MTVVNFRTDAEAQRALDELTADGTSVSAAIRQALLDSVVLRKRERMRREYLEVVDDPADLAEKDAMEEKRDAMEERDAVVADCERPSCGQHLIFVATCSVSRASLFWPKIEARYILIRRISTTVLF